MAITPLTVTIDLNPSYKKIPAVYVSQLDNNLRSLAITVKDGGVNYDVASSGYDVYVEGTKPDKHGFSYKVTDIGGTVVGSVVTVPMQTQMTCVQGMVPTEIVLKSGSDRIGSANFLLVVERAGLAEDVDVSETDIPAYIDGAQQAAAAAAQSADDAEDAKDAAVDAKDTAVAVAASIPADYTTLSNDVDDLKNAFFGYLNSDKIAFEVVNNSYVDHGVITPYNGWDRTDYINLEHFKSVTAVSSAQSSYNAFYDAEKTYISGFTVYTTETAVNIPNNAKYMILSNTRAGIVNTVLKFTDKAEYEISALSATVAADYLGVMILAYNGGYPYIDTKNKKLTIPTDTLLMLKSGDVSVAMSSGADAVIDYSAVSSSAIKIYFDYVSKTYTARNYLYEKSATEVLICLIRSSANGISASMSCPFYMDGKAFGLYESELNENIRSINHRGFNTVAPENTLPAFRLSKRKGFNIVETDLAYTSDNVPVLLHDASINRTARNADGTAISSTVNIADITYTQALTYDFGIWMGSQYAGTKIPTFTEFIKLCRNIGLEAYVELKIASTTQAMVNALIEEVKKCGMLEHITWISYSNTFLGYVKNAYSKARLGLVTSNVDATVIAQAQALKTDENEVFIDSSVYTDEACNLCINANIPMEIWSTNSASVINGLNAYISGVTSDSLVAGQVLYNDNIND